MTEKRRQFVIGEDFVLNTEKISMIHIIYDEKETGWITYTTDTIEIVFCDGQSTKIEFKDERDKAKKFFNTIKNALKTKE